MIRLYSLTPTLVVSQPPCDRWSANVSDFDANICLKGNKRSEWHVIGSKWSMIVTLSRAGVFGAGRSVIDWVACASLHLFSFHRLLLSPFSFIWFRCKGRRYTNDWVGFLDQSIEPYVDRQSCNCVSLLLLLLRRVYNSLNYFPLKVLVTVCHEI